MKIGIFGKAVGLGLIMQSCFPSIIFSQNKKDGAMLAEILQQSPYLDSVLKHTDSLGIQIIYTQVDRSRKGKPLFTDYFFHHTPAVYFYPASTVKLPVAILALQKLNELKMGDAESKYRYTPIEKHRGIGKVQAGCHKTKHTSAE